MRWFILGWIFFLFLSSACSFRLTPSNFFVKSKQTGEYYFVLKLIANIDIPNSGQKPSSSNLNIFKQRSPRLSNVLTTSPVMELLLTPVATASVIHASRLLSSWEKKAETFKIEKELQKEQSYQMVCRLFVYY
jgi:hypothetical protein